LTRFLARDGFAVLGNAVVPPPLIVEFLLITASTRSAIRPVGMSVRPMLATRAIEFPLTRYTVR